MTLRKNILAFGFSAITVTAVGGAEVVAIDFRNTKTVTTLFGSNAHVNDNQKVQNRLYDERILDRGFEWTADQKWTSTVIGAAATVTQDCTQSYGDRCSAKTNISTFPGGSLVALVQTALWVEAGQTYSFSFWAKQTGYGGNVTASIIDPNSFVPVTQTPILHNALATSWTHYTGEFTVNQSEVNGLLILQFSGMGAIWIDEMSLTPTVTLRGTAITTSGRIFSPPCSWPR